MLERASAAWLLGNHWERDVNDYEQGQHDAFRHVAEALSLYAKRLVECESKYKDSEHIQDLLGWAGVMREQASALSWANVLQDHASTIATKPGANAAFDEEGD
jgi:hypothetical protein